MTTYSAVNSVSFKTRPISVSGRMRCCSAALCAQAEKSGWWISVPETASSPSYSPQRLEERVRILHGDLREGIAGASGSVDVVSCNPPYMALRRGEQSQVTSRAIARQEICCSLEEAVNETARLLKNGGRAYFVYRPHRLDELFAACKAARLTPKRMKFAHPYSEREANLVLLEAVKGGGSFLRVEAPIIVFRSPGVYSDEIRDIYGY